jgi:hypothetical protein
MTEGITYYERDEELCTDPLCLSYGCRREHMSEMSPALDQAIQDELDHPPKSIIERK